MTSLAVTTRYANSLKHFFNDAAAPPLALSPGRRQWLPVSAHIRERYLVSYRAPAGVLARLLPAPLEIDAHGKFGFISVCVLEMDDMGIVGLPRWLRFANREILYRVGVRVNGRPSFYTLRSDTSSPALALLGRFSHYRLRLCQMTCGRAGGPGLHLVCRSRDGRADADFQATPEAAATPPRSLFAGAEEASTFLLGMGFSVDVAPGGRVRVQDIDHDPWGARFVTPQRRHFDFLDDLARTLETTFVYDNTLAMTDLHQTWRAARWI